jgi:hypothetical protein
MKSLLLVIIFVAFYCCSSVQSFNVHLLALREGSNSTLQLIIYTDGIQVSVANLSIVPSAYFKIQAAFSAANHAFFVIGQPKFNNTLDFLVIDAQHGTIVSKTSFTTGELLLGTLFSIYYDFLAQQIVDLHYDLTDVKPRLFIIDPIRHIMTQSVFLSSFQTFPDFFATDLRPADNIFGYCVNRTQYCVTNISLLVTENSSICGVENRWPAYSMDLVGSNTFLVITGGDMPMIMKVSFVGTNLKVRHLKMFDDGIPITNIRYFDVAYQFDTNGVSVPVHASLWKAPSNSSLFARVVSFDQSLESSIESLEMYLSGSVASPDFVPLAIGFSGQRNHQNPISPPASPSPFKYMFSCVVSSQ